MIKMYYHNRWKEGKIFDRSHITRADELETFISKFCEKEAFEEEFGDY
jgi:hypothetical protein